MLTATICPDSLTLEAHARDNLPSHAAATLDRHFCECRSCLNRYFELGKPFFAPEISGFQIVKEIGRGRFGVVYKAWWLQDKPRIVALKVLSYGGQMEKTRFEREIAVLKKIDSPWIVKCLESGATGEARYYVMDYIDGVHLDEYLGSSGLSLNEKLAALQRVCRAVADAHAEGVIHRDLKPNNILVDANEQPHILDFGVCAVEPEDWSSWDTQTITHPGDIIGTLKYMSPEQAWGGVAGPVDERGDIWALGIMLYEIVTDGDYPYSLGPGSDKPPHEALLQRIRKELPRLPRLDLVPRGRDLEVLLERCLAWEPNRRIKTVAALSDDLKRYVRHERIKTRPLGLSYRLNRLAVGAAARSRWMFSAAFVAMLGVILWAAAFLFNVGWHGTGRQPQGHGHPSAALVEPDLAREQILIVSISDETIEAVVRFARENGIEGVTPNVPTWRAVHGHLMKRLANARPVAVVWDYYCRTPRPGDAGFVAGIEALENVGVPVILAAATYRDDGTPDLSPSIVGPLGKRLRHGAIDARDMARRPGEFVVAMKRASDVIVPSLAMATLAAVLQPDTRLELDWPGRRPWINLLYEIGPGAYLRERDRVELTRVILAGSRQTNVRPDNLLACNRFALKKPEFWAQRSVPYQSLLTCSDDQLRATTGGKLILFGDLRAPRFGFAADRHRVRYGTSIVDNVPGCYLLADATANLLGGGYTVAAFPLAPTTFLTMLLLSVIGCLLPIKLAAREAFEQRRYRWVLWAVLSGFSAWAFLVVVTTRSSSFVHLGMAVFSLLVPMAGAFWVEFARNRHRIFDRNRRAIGDQTLIPDGTITLAPKP